MTPQQANLAPCPFCGSQAEQFTDEYGEGIECKTCEFQFGPYTKLEHAIAAWNRRAPAPTEPAVDRDAPSIRDHADFREDIESLSTQKYKPTLKRIRKEIYDTIDRRVANAVAAALATPASPAVPAPAPLAPYDALFKAIAAGTVVAGNAVSVSVKAFTAELAKQGYTVAPQVAQASQPTSAEGKDSERLEGGAL